MLTKSQFQTLFGFKPKRRLSTKKSTSKVGKKVTKKSTKIGTRMIKGVKRTVYKGNKGGKFYKKADGRKVYFGPNVVMMKAAGKVIASKALEGVGYTLGYRAANTGLKMFKKSVASKKRNVYFGGKGKRGGRRADPHRKHHRLVGATTRVVQDTIIPEIVTLKGIVADHMATAAATTRAAPGAGNVHGRLVEFVTPLPKPMGAPKTPASFGFKPKRRLSTKKSASKTGKKVTRTKKPRTVAMGRKKIVAGKKRTVYKSASGAKYYKSAKGNKVYFGYTSPRMVSPNSRKKKKPNGRKKGGWDRKQRRRARRRARRAGTPRVRRGGRGGRGGGIFGGDRIGGGGTPVTIGGDRIGGGGGIEYRGGDISDIRGLGGFAR